MPDVYYFGCAEPHASGGHAWYGRGLRRVPEDVRKTLPKGLDGWLAPTENKQYGTRPEMPQGMALLVQLRRHTVVAFWDRTGDARPNSNSSFVAEGHHTFDEMIEDAMLQFPRLFARFDFCVQPVDA